MAGRDSAGLLDWLVAWAGAPFSCCAAAPGGEAGELVPDTAGAAKSADAEEMSSISKSTSAGSLSASPAEAVDSPRSLTRSWPGRDAQLVSESDRGSQFVRTTSFEVDHSELPELNIPAKEQPLVSGHLDVHFENLSKAMFVDEGSPFTAFLCGTLGCFNVQASPFVDEAAGSASTMVQRSTYRLPLPADVPEVAIRLLRLGKSVSSATFTRAVAGPGRITLQQISRTEGLLYSERMRVMNIHCLEADPAGGVTWRTHTRIVWTRPLPWTHSFIAKIIDSRVKSEMKGNMPHLMLRFKEAAELVAPRR